MNITSLMKEIIEYRLGLDVMHVSEYYDQIKTMLEEKTLRTFSEYVPYTLTDTYVMCQDKRENTTCLFNPIKTFNGSTEWSIHHPRLARNNISIISLIRVMSTESALHGVPRARATFDLEGMLDYSLVTNIASRMSYKHRRWAFLPPTRVRLVGFGTTSVVLRIKIPYASFSSIPQGFNEIFHKLASLDVRIFLYNKLKYIEDLETPLGNISLRISDWEGALNEREEFLNDLNPELVKQNLFANGRVEYRN